MNNDNDGAGTIERLSNLAQELGLVDWREWLQDFDAEAVLSGLVCLDLDTLPFTGGEA